MKKLVLLFALAALIIYGCKKSDSTDDSSALCKLAKSIVTTNGTAVTTFYTYDNSGKISVVWQQTGKGDTTQARKYLYTGNLFLYSVGKDNNGNTDTTFYSYDGSQRISQTLKKNHNSGITLTVVSSYTYNSENQVTTTVTRSTMDNVNFNTDSTIYQYSDVNVSGYSQFTRLGSGTWSTYRVNFGYDDKKNYLKSTGEPALSHLYWSANNLNRFFYPDSTDAFMTYNFTGYSDSQYPLNYTVSFRPEQPNTVISGTLSYKCD
jgi:hypothetical protein